MPGFKKLPLEEHWDIEAHVYVGMYIYTYIYVYIKKVFFRRLLFCETERLALTFAESQ